MLLSRSSDVDGLASLHRCVPHVRVVRGMATCAGDKRIDRASPVRKRPAVRSQQRTCLSKFACCSNDIVGVLDTANPCKLARKGCFHTRFELGEIFLASPVHRRAPAKCLRRYGGNVGVVADCFTSRTFCQNGCSNWPQFGKQPRNSNPSA